MQNLLLRLGDLRRPLPAVPGSSNSQFIKVLAGLGVAGAILAAIFGFLQHSNIPLPFRI